MDKLKELQEAREQAVIVIEKIDRALDTLDSAKFWGMWDMFGGEFFSSWKKRKKIKKANRYIEGITDSVRDLEKELKDVDMVLPEEISNTIGDRAFDIWFDNIFTDMKVQRKIKGSIRELKEFRNVVEDLVIRLDHEIEKLEK